MRCKLKSLTALALMTLILSGCASSGGLPNPNEDRSVNLPPVPGDIKACLAHRVGAPPEGKLSRRVVFDKLAELKLDNDAKARCGQRLICWIEDIERGLASPADRKPEDPVCASLKQTANRSLK